MFAKATLTALAIAITAPAYAGGIEQLEKAAGVEPGVYSLAELTVLVNAIEDHDLRLINFITGGKSAGVTRLSGDAMGTVTSFASTERFVDNGRNQ